MKTKFTLTLAALLIALSAAAQKSGIELSFTAIDNATVTPLDSIKVMNLTQGGDTLLVWPDTVLSLTYVGIPEMGRNGDLFKTFQNYPNPVTDQTTISVYVPDKDQVTLAITDMLGRVVHTSTKLLDKGLHSFRFTPGGSNFYFFTARYREISSSIKILQVSSGSDAVCSLDYIGSESSSPPLKTVEDFQAFKFNEGDELLLIGYINDLQSGMLEKPYTSDTCTFQFATNIPCPGTPTVDYEGQVYNTIQVFSQCWLKENLNVGWAVPGFTDMTDNGYIEKYCYNDKPDSCAKYGGLYQWDEMMQYSTEPMVQGICPSGWHLPTDSEWKALEGAVDSFYSIGDSVWDRVEFRGSDVGKNLKSLSYWLDNGNGSDIFGFSGFPGGGCNNNGFGTIGNGIGINGLWWTSTEGNGGLAWYRHINHDLNDVVRIESAKTNGMSVRCIRDEVYIKSIKLSFTALNSDSYLQLDSIKVMNRTQDRGITLYWADTTLLLPDELSYNTGDELLYIGYADTLESGMVDNPEESKIYTFQFATNIPCPGTPSINYEGQIYNTIQIFSQCWLKENLNIGTMIQGGQDMANNEVIEKYCYNNEPDSCTKYGGLYQWDEMMQFDTLQGIQGICPQGWHLPTDEEWKVLEGIVDSQYKIGDSVWDWAQSRGFDAGKNLKTTSGWNGNGNGTDLFGISALPGGSYNHYNTFYDIEAVGNWWTSSEWSSWRAWDRTINWSSSGISRPWSNAIGHMFHSKTDALSVRCLKDY